MCVIFFIWFNLILMISSFLFFLLLFFLQRQQTAVTRGTRFSGVVCQSVQPPRSRQRYISGMPWGHFVSFSTNVHLDSRMNWLHFGVQSLSSPWPYKPPPFFWGHNSKNEYLLLKFLKVFTMSVAFFHVWGTPEENQAQTFTHGWTDVADGQRSLWHVFIHDNNRHSTFY